MMIVFVVLEKKEVKNVILDFGNLVALHGDLTVGIYLRLVFRNRFKNKSISIRSVKNKRRRRRQTQAIFFR